MHVILEQITPAAERRIIRIARVSNPKNQDNEEVGGLIRYCIRNGHWSVFEHAHMTLEIQTSLAIATQILRHRSFTFQQFSQRYSDPLGEGLTFETIDLRRQAKKNRQSSEDYFDEVMVREIDKEIKDLFEQVDMMYHSLLAAGVAKECARMVLPQATQTRLYMTGNVRSWIHYIEQRTKPDTQKEHRLIALEAQKVFNREMPTIGEALQWMGEAVGTK